MKIRIIKILIIFMLFAPKAQATDVGYQSYDWISSSLDALSTLFHQCLEVPKFNSYNTGSVNLDASKNGVWVPANVQVQSGKSLNVDWNANGVTAAPRKYFVMYRVDPRFTRPQIFILKYDYINQVYVSDYNNFPVPNQNCSCSCSNGVCSSASSTTSPICTYTCSKSSVGNSTVTTSPAMLLPDCQANLTTDAYYAKCLNTYKDYFNFTNTGAARANTIAVNNGDVVSINLVSSDIFFGAGSDFTGELQYDDHILNSASIYTTTNLTNDNQIIYASSSAFCNTLFSGGTPPSGTQYTCKAQSDSSYLYGNLGGYPSLFLGLLDSMDIKTSESPPPNPLPTTITLPTTIYPCPIFQGIDYTKSNSYGPIYKQSNSLCFFNNGSGMNINLSGTSISPSYTSNFVKSPFTGKYFLYYKNAGGSGYLNFTTDWMLGVNTSPKPSMFNNIDPTTLLTSNTDHVNLQGLQNYISNSTFQQSNALAKFMHLGRYFMEIEIGSGAALAVGSSNNLNVQYTITSDPTTPSSSANAYNTSITPASDGYLWFRVVNPNPSTNNLSGTITVSYANFIGSNVLSNTLNTYLIIPITSSIEDLTTLLYSGLSRKGNTLSGIAKTCLSLYVIFYALYFLAGATQIKTMDLLTRIIKITIVVAMFNTGSWNYFNNNFFVIFTQGFSYLVNSVIGLSSSPGNVFGFIDIIFIKYLDLHLWRALGIQLLQLPSGLTFFALMVISGIWIYFRAVLEVVIGYIMAFLSMSVLISLAPIFVTFMLFEKTKHLFNNWISALLNCMLQPTVLLIFFLLINQIMTQQLYGAVVECCWGWLVDLELNLSFKPALDFSLGPVPIPFLPGIPFYIPQLPSGDPINGVNGAYLTIVSSSIMFYCLAVMSRGLVNYVSSIVTILTGIEGVAGQSSAASITKDLQGEAQKDGTLRGGLRSKITGDVEKDPNTGQKRRVGGIGGFVAGIGRDIKNKTIDQNYGTNSEEQLKHKRLIEGNPDKGDDKLRDKIANRNTRHDFKDNTKPPKK